MEASVAPIWLAAVVTPWAIAPHPNFSVQQCTPAELLALNVDQRMSDRDRYAEQVAYGTEWEGNLVSAAVDSFLFGRQEDAIPRLLSVTLDRDVVYAARAASALLMSVALADLDRPEEAADGLRLLIDESENQASASGRLVVGALHQQLALRLVESGFPTEAQYEAERVVAGLDRHMTGFERLKVSRGTAMSSSRLQNEIRLGIARNAHALLSYLEPIDGTRWIKLIRGRNSWIRSRGDASALRGATEFISEAFDSRLREVGRPQTWSAETATGQFERSLLAAELSGDFHAVNTRREQLAKIRVTRSSPGDNFWSTADAIGLLRRGDFKDTLDATIRWARAGGPLEALASASDALLRRPSFPERCSRGDVALLSGSAELLNCTQAESAIDAIIRYTAGNSRRGLEADVVAEWSRRDIGLRALAKVAPQAPARHSEVSRVTLEVAKSSQHLYAMSGGVAAVVREIDWDATPRDEGERWLSWAHSLTDPENLDLVQTVSDAINGPGYTRQSVPRPTGLALGARLLFEFFQEVPPDPNELKAAASACISVMERELESVKTGVRHFGGYSEAEIATAMALQWPDSSDLWDPIIRTLSTPQLGMDARSAALDRIARAPSQVPDDVVDALRSQKVEVLAPGPAEPMFGTAYSPPVTPSAVRALAALGILDFGEAVAWVAQLAAMPEAAGRREASTTASSIAVSFNQSVDWALIALMQLAHDQDPVVCAAAGRALPVLLSFDAGLQDSAESTVDSLLRAPGLVIPLSTLRGLEDSVDEVRRALLPTLEYLGVNHAARSVRDVARQIHQAWSGSLQDG